MSNTLKTLSLTVDEKETLIILFKRWAEFYRQNTENYNFISRDIIYKTIKEELSKTGNWRKRGHKRNANIKSSINLSKNKNNPINNQDDDDDWGKPVAFKDRYIPKGDPNKPLNAKQEYEINVLKNLGYQNLHLTLNDVNKIWESLERENVYLPETLDDTIQGYKIYLEHLAELKAKKNAEIFKKNNPKLI